MNTKNIRFTIGGPETPDAGDEAARTHVLPIRDKPGFREQAEKTVDPVITGVNMATGEYTVAKNLNGSIPLSPRPCGGFGKVLNSLLGQEGTPAEIGAVMRIRYGGAEASAKISASGAGDTLTSDVGDLGAEAGDANFGTSGDIDLTAAATDTVAELVAVIAAYDDYEAELVTGAGTVSTADIISITSAQAKGRWVYIFFTAADSDLYLHQWPVVLNNGQRPTYSVQGDGIHANYLGLGVAVDQLTLSGALKAIIEAEATALGFSWTPGETASEVTLEAVDPFLFYEGSFSVNGVTHPFIRNISIDAMNNGNPEGYGMGSASRQYHDKGEFASNITLQVRYSADVYALYAMIATNVQAGLDVYFKTPSALSGSIYGLLIIEAPYCNISDYDPQDNGGALDASINLKVVNPPSAYGSPFRVSMITADAAAY